MIIKLMINEKTIQNSNTKSKKKKKRCTLTHVNMEFVNSTSQNNSKLKKAKRLQ